MLTEYRQYGTVYHMDDKLGFFIYDIIIIGILSIPVWFSWYECVADIIERRREGRMNRFLLFATTAMALLTIGAVVFVVAILRYKYCD